jgi:GT2 family glycosyltransferase
MKPPVSIIIINYNTRHLLKTCIESLLAQSCRDLEIIFIDNYSIDQSCRYVRENFPALTAVCNGKNLGYAAAANQGIGMSKGEYVMIINPDIIFEPDYVEKCVAKMKEDSQIAAICGKIYKYDFAENKKTDVIDTVGLFCFRNRRVIDEGQGVKDTGQFNEPHEVFGVSGACPLYRRSALEDAKVFEEYLDADFFMYKEDVDLSWRLRIFGWKCFYLPSAVGYHGRGTGALKRFSHVEVMKNRAGLSRFTKYYSYKNQRLMQIKNEFARGFLHDFFPIIWKEILIKGYIVFREPYLFKALFQMLSQTPRALKKRKYIMSRARVSWREMEKWLSNKKTAHN